MKPSNFPERKRQRQSRALARLKQMTSGKPGKPPRSNAAELEWLRAVAAKNLRDVRTKKDRSSGGRFGRATA